MRFRETNHLRLRAKETSTGPKLHTPTSDIINRIYICNCRAADARVCWMIRYGEHPDRNPRCSCECHQEKP